MIRAAAGGDNGADDNAVEGAMDMHLVAVVAAAPVDDEKIGLRSQNQKRVMPHAAPVSHGRNGADSWVGRR